MARSFRRQSRPSTRAASVAGRPSGSVERVTFAARLPRLPQYRKLSIRTLMKRDVAKGITMPEADNMTTVNGLAPMGATTTRISRQQPQTPPGSNAGLRTVKPPNPAGKGGRIGRRLRDGQ